MGNKKISIVGFLVTAFWIHGMASGVIDSAQKLLVYQKYDAAEKVLDNRLKKVPTDIDALYLLLAVKQTRILDYESYTIDGKKFERLADSIRQVLEERCQKLEGKDSIDCVFYIANTYGGMSIMQAKNGNWFDGVKNALTSVSHLKTVRKLDPDFYAANLGIGVFDYYLSSSLKWLPFVDEDAEKGVKAIRKATKAQFPYNYAAQNSLCWIFIEQKKYKQADSLAASVLKQYPENTIFLRIRTHIAFWSGQYKKAINLAEQFAALSEKRSPMNWSDLVSGYTILAKSYERQGNKEKSLEAANYIIEKNIPEAYLAIPHVKKNVELVIATRDSYQSKSQ